LRRIEELKIFNSSTSLLRPHPSYDPNELPWMPGTLSFSHRYSTIQLFNSSTLHLPRLSSANSYNVGPRQLGRRGFNISPVCTSCAFSKPHDTSKPPAPRTKKYW